MRESIRTIDKIVGKVDSLKEHPEDCVNMLSDMRIDLVHIKCSVYRELLRAKRPGEVSSYHVIREFFATRFPEHIKSHNQEYFDEWEERFYSNPEYNMDAESVDLYCSIMEKYIEKGLPKDWDFLEFD